LCRRYRAAASARPDPSKVRLAGSGTGTGVKFSPWHRSALSDSYAHVNRGPGQLRQRVTSASVIASGCCDYDQPKVAVPGDFVRWVRVLPLSTPIVVQVVGRIPRGASAPAQSRVTRARSCCPSSLTDRIVISVRRQGTLRVAGRRTDRAGHHEDHFGGIDDLVLLAKVHVLESYDRGTGRSSRLPRRPRKPTRPSPRRMDTAGSQRSTLGSRWVDCAWAGTHVPPKRSVNEPQQRRG
jgi:hypothetical protein